MLYLNYYLMGIILLPGIIFSIYAQNKVNKSFNEGATVLSSYNKSAKQIIYELLLKLNMTNITIIQTDGNLTDYYNSKNKEIALSTNNIDSTTVSSIAVACHELGHAIQDKEKYLPLKIRQIIIPLCNISSKLLWPLVVIGLACNFLILPYSNIGDIFMWGGIVFFGLAFLLNVCTLPVEYNASKRALKLIEENNILQEDEILIARDVLNAAALTYIAATVVSFLNLLRFLLVILKSNKRD